MLVNQRKFFKFYFLIKFSKKKICKYELLYFYKKNLKILNLFPSVLISIISDYAYPLTCLIIVGGNDECDAMIGNEIFNVEKNQWELFASLPERLHGGFLIQAKNELFLIGGTKDREMSATSSCYHYNLNDENALWTSQSEMNIPRIFPCGWYEENQNEIYIFGGCCLSQNREKVELNGGKYNLNTRKWIQLFAQLPNIEFYRSLPLYQVNHNEVYFFALINPLKYCCCYNIKKDCFTYPCPMPTQWLQSLNEPKYHSCLPMCFQYPLFYIGTGQIIRTYDVNNRKSMELFEPNKEHFYSGIVPNRDIFNCFNNELILLCWHELEIINLVLPNSQRQTLPLFQSSRYHYASMWIHLKQKTNNF